MGLMTGLKFLLVAACILHSPQVSGQGAVEIVKAVVDLAQIIAKMWANNGRKSVSIFNETPTWLQVHCRSRDDNFGNKILQPGEAFFFEFRGNVMGTTLFYCELHYSGYVVAWDVFDAKKRNYGTNDLRWRIRHDAVYLDGKGKKVGLAAGNTKFTVHEGYDSNKQPTGKSLVGYLSQGTCNNFVNGWNDVVSAVSLNAHLCVTLWQHNQCGGSPLHLDARDGKNHYWYLTSTNDWASSISECNYHDNTA